MDTKQISDTLAMVQADINSFMDMHSSDFMYFSQWLQELDKKTREVDAKVLKLEKTSQFVNMMKSGVPVKTGVSKKVLVVGVGLALAGGFVLGVRARENYKGPQKGAANG